MHIKCLLAVLVHINLSSWVKSLDWIEYSAFWEQSFNLWCFTKLSSRYLNQLACNRSLNENPLFCWVSGDTSSSKDICSSLLSSLSWAWPFLSLPDCQNPSELSELWPFLAEKLLCALAGVCLAFGNISQCCQPLQLAEQSWSHRAKSPWAT